jgi:hypothetical protein
MKRLLLSISCWCVLVGAATAQQPDFAAEPAREPSLADVTPTPTENMWLYLQEMRRYDDPRQAVRRKAEERSQQRRDRIAALKRLGYSKQRPPVMQSPNTSIYSPMIYLDPYRIFGGGYPPMTMNSPNDAPWQR